MNRKQILLKHLGNIHISDATMKVVINAMFEAQFHSLYNKLPTQFSGTKLAIQLKTLDDMNIDWKLLAKQKESLITVRDLMKTESKYTNLEDDPLIQDLTGILHLIDGLQDENCKE